MPGAPAADEALAGATLIVNVSASPYFAGKGRQREQMLVQRARDNLAAVAFCNLVGGQDELVFDGHSVVIDHEGTVLARVAAVRRGAQLVHGRPPGRGHGPAARHAPAAAGRARRCPRSAISGRLERRPRGAARPGRRRRPAARARAGGLRRARASGMRDYVAKNGFGHVVLGLSGGIDSTLVALIAVDALGADKVTCVVMPSRYSSRGHAERRAGARRRPRRAVLRPADRRRDGGLRRRCSRRSSATASRTSPRRTCRRASAATC